MIRNYPGEFSRSTFHSELRHLALSAWGAIHRQQRDLAALIELPIANLTRFTAELNRDSTKRPEPFPLDDFLLFKDRKDDNAVLDPEVAAVALALKHEDRCPPLVISVWPQILASVKDGIRAPAIRALRSDDDAVWVLSPKWEGNNVRGGLVAVRGSISGAVILRDLDRPLNTHRLVLPKRPGFGWVEARSLLVAPET